MHLNVTKNAKTGKTDITMGDVIIGVMEREKGRVIAKIWRTPVIQAIFGDDKAASVLAQASLPSSSVVYHEATRKNFEMSEDELLEHTQGVKTAVKDAVESISCGIRDKALDAALI